MLKEKICFVSGGSRGIGKEIVKTFAENGALVYTNARNLSDFNRWLPDLPPSIQKRIIPVIMDIRDSSAVRNTILEIKQKHNHIDVWVNNAAITYNETIGMISPNHVHEMFETNVYPIIDSLQLISRVMQRQNSGSIINLSSIVGVEGHAGQLAYSATKGAVNSITKSASKELAPYQIRVNAVAPGLTKTKLMEAGNQKCISERIMHIGMGRVAEPRDIANTCLYLASDLSVYVTGQIIGVNGASII